MEALTSGFTPLPKNTEQDVDVRKSLRNAGRDSGRRISNKVYPGSGRKPHVRRSLRTPIQTIPLQVADGRTEKSASRSFIFIPDQEDTFTPRSNIEGFLAAAAMEEPDNTTPDVSKRPVASSSANTVFKIPDQPDSFDAPRAQVSASTPGSKFTPRTNIFSLIHYMEDPEQTPTVRNDWLDQPSSETGVSTTKHQEWGQEVSLSPMYLSRTCDDKEDSPSTVKQAFKRPRRSFHIPVSQTVVTALQGAREQISAAEENPVVMNASESDDADVMAGTGLEEAREPVFQTFDATFDFGSEGGGLAAAVSENLDFFASKHLSGIQAPTLENLDAEVCTSLEGRHLSALEKVDAQALSEKLDFFLETDLGIPSCVVPENLDVFVDGEGVNNNQDVEDDSCAAADETLKNADIENMVHETLVAAKDLMTDEENVNEMLGMGEGDDDVAEKVNNTEESKWVVSKSSGHQVATASEMTTGLDALHALNETGHDDNVTSNELVPDAEEEPPNAGSSGDIDANTEKNNACGAEVGSAGGNDEMGFEIVEEDPGVEHEGAGVEHEDPGVEHEDAGLEHEDAGVEHEDAGVEHEDPGVEHEDPGEEHEDPGVEHEEGRKEKSFGGGRTSLTSKHGKISYSLTPKRIPKDTQEAPAPSSSVYDLSENSNSSGDVHITEQKSSTRRKETNNSKSSGKRGIGSAKSSKQNISLKRASVSINKSKPSYSEWKSMQRGKDSTGQTITSFFDSHYPLSSTPSDRTKKIFHSTKIHHSLHANEDLMLDTQMTDSIPNISPIRPFAKNQAEKRTGSILEMLDADTDRDDEDGVEEGSAGIQHRESGFMNQGAQKARLDEDEDSTDAAFPGFSPLATPHIDMDKRTEQSAAWQKSERKPLAQPQPSKSKQKSRKETDETKQPPRKRTKTSSDTALPRRSVKFFAERHSTMKLSKDAIEEIERVSEVFWDNTFKALETFALHAGRKIVKEEDVVLLMKTQRLIKDTEDLHDGIREFLPMELRSELIPIAKP